MKNIRLNQPPSLWGFLEFYTNELKTNIVDKDKWL